MTRRGTEAAAARHLGSSARMSVLLMVMVIVSGAAAAPQVSRGAEHSASLTWHSYLVGVLVFASDSPGPGPRGDFSSNVAFMSAGTRTPIAQCVPLVRSMYSIQSPLQPRM